MAESWFMAGYQAKKAGDYTQAKLAYERALQAAPDYADVRYNLAVVQLLTGDFAPGWEGYEYRWLAGDHPDLRAFYPRPRWEGEDLDGESVLVWCEQGLGDAIQFIRFAPMMAARGARVVLECPQSLSGLFAVTEGVSEVRVRPPRAMPDLEGIDRQIAIASLPGAFAWSAERPVGRIPYLRVPEGSAKTLPPARGGLKVGVMWAGSPTPDPFRTCPLAELAPLFAMPGISFFSLQTGGQRAELAAMDEAIRPVDLEPGDFADTAALVAQLDLVITIDTSMAHLAGGLSVPTWVLLPRLADWRWLLGRDDTPWYPSARLFRQSVQGQWADVVERVGVELRAAVNDRHSRESGNPLPHPAG